ncbi:Similar to UDP-Gal:betaGlcNAc beta 1,3-galactosyltransferase, polypeptide 2, related [Eimeria tenella]|uniref:Hexosyltransferase n=1 Tax=Eimeria tenella TaxID=5802 RepID=U6KZR6_EIMTE|nr:Similar to UDP-Gal:betaGlcNAc beta 1,3-galactosyltransferase, polypeptide 2, related [Eimeria tenella]CDJ40985.1 Similar to UDP-Gal:betaGlcNAc beta 1,3-galactosyltransferase, polypeptide 2, related [Eimeria tenella]|eukprot:XP_013231735.1 Similar to UDP-Gal:betaGlcNAc beta 1,3-galactosyltransferase, polypeptide 2, related [Eimeria tenella]
MENSEFLVNFELKEYFEDLETQTSSPSSSCIAAPKLERTPPNDSGQEEVCATAGEFVRAYWLLLLLLLVLFVLSLASEVWGWQWAAAAAPAALLSLPVQTQWPLLLQPSSSCSKDPPFAAVLVLTAPGDWGARAAVRGTWGGEGWVWGRRLRVFFVTPAAAAAALQQQLRSEAQQHGDILQLAAPDSYRLLTHKTKAALQWAAEFCSEAAFLVKADADIYLNLEKLVAFLEAKQGAPLAAGAPHQGAPLITDPTHRNYQDPALLPHRAHYPPYLAGPLYILSGELGALLARGAPWLPLLSNEDCFVGVLLEALGAPLESTGPGAPISLYAADSDDFAAFKNFLAVHPVSPQRLLQLWQQLH